MKNLEKYICVFDKYRKENKYQHFKIEENHNTILKMQGALETQRKLRTSQIDLEQLYNILQELSEGFSIQEVAKIFDRDIRSIKSKIEIITNRRPLSLDKHNRYVCPKCLKRVMSVKTLNFAKLYEHLLGYSFSRLFFVSNAIKEKWKAYRKYWYSELNTYNKNRNKKNLVQKEVKKSVTYLVNSFKKISPDEFAPSPSTIYKIIKKYPYFLEFDHIVKKSEGKYGTRKQKQTKPKTLKYATEISKRPDYINDRLEHGHFELDTVIGKINDTYCIVTIIERQTRMSYAMLSKRNSKAIKQTLLKLIKKHNLDIKTLTVDNGSENVLLHHVIPTERLFKCQPYSSWQKGSIENMHRLIRYYIPKGKSFDKYSQHGIDYMMDKINNYRQVVRQYKIT